MRRLAARRICRSCGCNADAVDVGGRVRARCGGPLVQRTDDGEAVVRERLRVYQRQTPSRSSTTIRRGRRSGRSTATSRPTSWRRDDARPSRHRGRPGRAGRRSDLRDRLPVARGDREVRAANRLVARGARGAGRDGGPGVTTAELDRLAEALVRAAGAEPAFKGYTAIPATMCASVNEQVVHGIPSRRGCSGRATSSRSTWASSSTASTATSAVTVPVGAVGRRRRSCCG